MVSKLIENTSYEPENKTEVSLRASFELLESQLRPPLSFTIPTQTEYLTLNSAILYAILCEPHSAHIHIKHLHAKITDGYSFFTHSLVKVATDLYPKLVGSAKVQLVWVCNEMVSVSAIGVDSLLVALLRQIVDGDFSEGNMWLCSELVSLFLKKWDCLLEEEPLVLTSALYVFLRVLTSHCKIHNDPRLEVLKRMEIDFCIRMLREQFQLSMKIGRDLVRLLQELVFVPEFRDIWKGLLINPSEFKFDGYSDLSQLYLSRTSSRYFLLRITPEMETWLRFLLTYVKFGSQRRYQAWFGKKFLASPENEASVIDIVRFICCSHHPSNEIIYSEIIPRWAVIGWLLSSCRKHYIETNAKLALFYDWLFFDEKTDNIMNIEPAILLMVNSIPHHIDITNNLLEYLFLLMDNYDSERRDMIKNGIKLTFFTLAKRGVIKSLDDLANCNVLSPILKQRLVDLLFVAQTSVQKEIKVFVRRHKNVSDAMI